MLNPNNIEDEHVQGVFDQYPLNIQKKLLSLRQLIIQTAIESDEIDALIETLKWGEPSYMTKIGSTVRLGWKQSTPQQYMLYFHCKTKLVDTFKELYGNTFRYEGSRAIIFQEDDKIPKKALAHCIHLSLVYKNVSALPLLGAQPLV